MWEKQLEAAIKAGLMAQNGILEVYHQDFAVEIKSDDSPVTLADKNADAAIRKNLHEAFPEYAFLTEESTDDMKRLENDFVWIVDPVDGTKDFVARDDEFTTCIALAYKHQVVVGVIVVPARNELYYASKGNGAFHRVNGKDVPIHVNAKRDDLTCLLSVFHTNKAEADMIQKHADLIKHTERHGSSIKPCLIAEGKAEVHYRLSPGTKEWDTAASDIIVREAGGVFLKPDLTDIAYNRVDVYNREGYVVANCLENVLL